MKLIIDIPDKQYEYLSKISDAGEEPLGYFERVIMRGTPLTLNVLADKLMEERIRGELNNDTIFEKDIIRDVKCRLEVSIRDSRPCYCGAGLSEVWRESEDK